MSNSSAARQEIPCRGLNPTYAQYTTVPSVQNNQLLSGEFLLVKIMKVNMSTTCAKHSKPYNYIRHSSGYLQILMYVCGIPLVLCMLC